MRPTLCLFCNRDMVGGTKKQWIILRATGAILGQSHKGCWDLQVYRSKTYLGVPEAKIYGRPSEAEIAFAQKMANINDDLGKVKYRELSSLHKRARFLSFLQWPYSDLEEFFDKEETLKILDHWIYGSQIITPEGLKELKDYFRKAFQEESS